MAGEFLGLAAADVGAGVQRFELLRAVADDDGPGRGGQLGEFIERIAHLPGGARLEFHADQEGAFGFLSGGFEEGFHAGIRPAG